MPGVVGQPDRLSGLTAPVKVEAGEFGDDLEEVNTEADLGITVRVRSPCVVRVEPVPYEYGGTIARSDGYLHPCRLP